MKINHPTYQELLTEVPKIQRYFTVAWLEVPDEEFKLVTFAKHISDASPTLMIMAGCHGEEPAPPLALFKNYRLIAEAAEKYRVNVIIYPLVNPWGFSRDKRFNRQGLSCNTNWIHPDRMSPTKEIAVIKKDMKKYAPKIFISMHEDSDTKGSFYFYSFGDRTYEKYLLQAGKNHFPILKDGPFDGLEVKKGAVYELHDGTAEDYMSHRGRSTFSCCTETPLVQPVSKRIQCNTSWILELIKRLR
ncbi:MAG: succinylglutamate desuccinylase/aspartoacylase family protein [Candidatus Paceibacterota bacterium]